MRPRDLLTGDLFADIPKAAPATPGAMNYSREIAAVMGDALKASDHDRYEISARMSRMLGREVSISMLNVYTAESHDYHNISLERAIAFDAATEGYALLNFFAGKRGCRVMVGEDALLAELGRIKQTRDELAGQERAIREYLKGKR
mgnify:FL=1